MEETSKPPSSRKRGREELSPPETDLADQSLSLGPSSFRFQPSFLCPLQYYYDRIFLRIFFLGEKFMDIALYFHPNAEDNLTFSDTSVALRMMRSQFPRIDKVVLSPSLILLENRFSSFGKSLDFLTRLFFLN